MTENSICTIHPYKDGSTWVFDDPAVGLVKEALVAGIPEIIAVATESAGIKNPEKGFTIVFGAIPFPGHMLVLEKCEDQHEEMTGTWYNFVHPLSDELMEGWLCPALLKYFKTPPERIYCQLLSKE